MAIPPIIANNPIIKLFKSEQSSSSKQEPEVVPQTPEDIVEISEVAQKRLNGIETLSADDSARVQEVTVETRDILQQDESLTLGLDPATEN